MSEIFPDKFTPVEQTIVGQAAALISLLGERSISIGQLYIEYKLMTSSTTFDSFAAALTFLYGAGVLDYQNQIVSVS